MKALVLVLVVATLSLAAGCGDDDTASTGESGATGVASAAGALSDADAKAIAQKSLLAIESYANAHGGSYAGANAEELAKIVPSLPSADLEVVSTDSSYTVTVVAESGTAFSLDGGGGVSPQHTCDPPGGSGCSADGDW